MAGIGYELVKNLDPDHFRLGHVTGNECKELAILSFTIVSGINS